MKHVDIIGKNLQETLKLLDRYQNIALTASLTFLLITWKWPWAGENLLNPPTPIPPAESIAIDLLPIELSIGLAVLLIFATYFATSIMAVFFANRVREISDQLLKESQELLSALLTYPSTATHQKRIHRLMNALVIILLVYLGMVREFWWEGSALLDAFGKGAILTILAIIPQLLVIQALWQPLEPEQGE